MNRCNSNEGEYIQYASEVEHVLSKFGENLHESDDPEAVVMYALQTACFYESDDAGFLEADTDLYIWRPYRCYNADPNDQT